MTHLRKVSLGILLGMIITVATCVGAFFFAQNTYAQTTYSLQSKSLSETGATSTNIARSSQMQSLIELLNKLIAIYQKLLAEQQLKEYGTLNQSVNQTESTTVTPTTVTPTVVTPTATTTTVYDGVTVTSELTSTTEEFTILSGTAKNISRVYLTLEMGEGNFSPKRSAIVSSNGSWTANLGYVRNAGSYTVTLRKDSYEGTILNRVIISVTGHVAEVEDSAGYVKVLSPNGGESFKQGDEVTIKWEAKNCSEIQIAWYHDRQRDGIYETYYTILSSKDAAQYSQMTSGSFLWKIPSMILGYTSHIPNNLIKIYCFGGSPVSDYSDQPFQIVTPSGSTLYSNTTVPRYFEGIMPSVNYVPTDIMNDTISVGETMDISWSTIHQDYVYISLIQDTDNNGSFETSYLVMKYPVYSGLNGTLTKNYLWTAPSSINGTNVTNIRSRIQVSLDPPGTIVVDPSRTVTDKTFSIIKP